jgi:hypothetical protein
VREWREIGPIVLLQVQREPMKEGTTTRVYKPNKLAQVERIWLTPAGITTELNGERIFDAHHAQHPRTRHRDASPLSFGLTSYNAQMQARFGDHLTLGIAGENIIVKTDALLTEDELLGEVAFRGADGRLTVLKNIFAAPPCKPFSAFCLHEDENEVEPHTIAETLRFLNNGTRGFYAQPVANDETEIRVGDVMLVSI